LWIVIKLGLVLLAALAAMAGLFHTLFAKRVPGSNQSHGGYQTTKRKRS
jgi:hypothetical protein